MTDPILHLDDPAATDPARCGTKAATLAALRRDGFAVPDGFVVTVDACADLGSDDMWAAVEGALAMLGDDPVAVRSSAVAEDLAGASFAGMYETVLGVRGADAVVEAMRHCLASVSSERVAVYAPGRTGPMAVLVQRMVDADAAGVAFSADPVTGDRDVAVVSAVAGLGDRLVDGSAVPDEWAVRDEEVEARAVVEEALDVERVRAVTALARRLEAHLGAPQDVEWAWDGARLWLLQSRPITVLPRQPRFADPPRGAWMKDRTHYPEPVTPFGASVYLPILRAGIARMCDEFGLLIEGVDQYERGGECYGRPVPVGGKEGAPPPWWLLAALARVVPPLRRRCATARRAVRSGLLEELPRRWFEEWRPQFVAEAERLADTDLASLDDAALLVHLDDAVDFLDRGQQVHFPLFMPFVVRTHELVRTCEELFGWDTGKALSLVAGRSETSAEPSRALRDLARRLADVPATRKAVEALDLNALADHGEGWAAFDEYRRRWGIRAVGYDPGSATLAERPHLLLRWVRDAMEHGGPGGGDGLGAATLAEARALLAERGEAERARFEDTLARTEAVYGVREDNILWTDNVPCGIIRLAAMEIGRRLHDRGLLGRPDDVVFLEIDEARRALVEGADSAETARRRRAERAWVAAHPGPPFVGDEPAPPPDVRGLPPEARLLNTAMMWAIGQEYPPPREPTDGRSDALLTGVGASPGSYTGPVRVVHDESEFAKVQPGDVLVCRITTPSWSVLFDRAGAVVADGGGALAHAAIVAREHGIPAVMGTGEATTTLRDGRLVTVDGVTGTVLTPAHAGGARA